MIDYSVSIITGKKVTLAHLNSKLRKLPTQCKVFIITTNMTANAYSRLKELIDLTVLVPDFEYVHCYYESKETEIMHGDFIPEECRYLYCY